MAAHAGLCLDPWQQLVMREMAAVRDVTYRNPLTKRRENKWAAKEFGLVMARQNGKNSCLEARELAGLFLWGERLIIHSAHQFDTSLEAFNRILVLIENSPDLDREVARVVRNHGEEGVELKSGQRLRFRTRTRGGGRGFTADCIVFDEAMSSLSAVQIGAIMPTVSARPNPQMIFTGSAGTKSSEHLGALRNRALKGIDGTPDPLLGYMEWSADPCGFFCPSDCELHDRRDDPRTWAKTNPSMGIRISEEHVAQEFRSMPAGEFDRERLSIGDWPSEGDGWRVIPKDAWASRTNELSSLSGKFCLAVDCAPDSTYTCITAAGPGEDGDVHGEITGTENLFDYRQGIRWAVPRIVDIWKANKPAFVVINPATPAGRLIDELQANGVKVVTVSSREYAQACGDLKYAVAPNAGEKAEFTHIDQAPMNTAVANANARPVQELWAWDKTESAADITPLTSQTLAFFGYKKHLFKKTANLWFYRG